jgi:hypothetical protein
MPVLSMVEALFGGLCPPKTPQLCIDVCRLGSKASRVDACALGLKVLCPLKKSSKSLCWCVAYG